MKTKKLWFAILIVVFALVSLIGSALAYSAEASAASKGKTNCALLSAQAQQLIDKIDTPVRMVDYAVLDRIADCRLAVRMPPIPVTGAKPAEASTLIEDRFADFKALQAELR